MNKWWFPAFTALVLLGGCSSVPRGSIPVVDSGTAVSNNDRISANGGFRQTTIKRAMPNQAQAVPQDSGVVVMVPGGGAATSAPVSSEPWSPGPSTTGPITPGPVDSTPIQTSSINQGSYSMPQPTGILERAQRVAPREPQVLYRLAQVRMAQGDAPQAEQLARRGLGFANGRPDLQASLWELIAQAREKQGDAASCC